MRSVMHNLIACLLITFTINCGIGPTVPSVIDLPTDSSIPCEETVEGCEPVDPPCTDDCEPPPPPPPPPPDDPLPVPPPDPPTDPPITAVSPDHYGDFLTLSFNGEDSAFLSGDTYYKWNRDERKAFRDAIKQRGYTRIYFDIFPPLAPDYFGDPEGLKFYLAEAWLDGLGPVVFLGPEDSRVGQAKYPYPAYRLQLGKFIPTIDEYVSDYVLGVEVEEYWTLGETSGIGRAVKALSSKTVWVHFKTPKVSRSEWWSIYKGWVHPTWVDGISFQYPKCDVAGSGFLACHKDIIDWTTYLVPRLHARGLKFLAGEYAFRRDEDKAVKLGNVAIIEGADGFSNGGSVPSNMNTGTTRSIPIWSNVRVLFSPHMI